MISIDFRLCFRGVVQAPGVEWLLGPCLWLLPLVMPSRAPPGVSQRHDAVAVSAGARALSPQAPLSSQPFGGAGGAMLVTVAAAFRDAVPVHI